VQGIPYAHDQHARGISVHPHLPGLRVPLGEQIRLPAGLLPEVQEGVPAGSKEIGIHSRYSGGRQPLPEEYPARLTALTAKIAIVNRGVAIAADSVVSLSGARGGNAPEDLPLRR
jgi:hypothetical protein